MARPAAVVVDASVAVKWFNREDESEQALALRDDHVAGRVLLAAPDLLVFEVLNALRYSPEHGSEGVGRALADLADLQVALVGPDAEWMEEAVEIAFQKGITLYDASTIALARHLRAKVSSSDERLLAAAGELAMPLAKYGSPRGL